MAIKIMPMLLLTIAATTATAAASDPADGIVEDFETFAGSVHQTLFGAAPPEYPVYIFDGKVSGEGTFAGQTLSGQQLFLEVGEQLASNGELRALDAEATGVEILPEAEQWAIDHAAEFSAYFAVLSAGEESVRVVATVMTFNSDWPLPGTLAGPNRITVMGVTGDPALLDDLIVEEAVFPNLSEFPGIACLGTYEVDQVCIDAARVAFDTAIATATHDWQSSIDAAREFLEAAKAGYIIAKRQFLIHRAGGLIASLVACAPAAPTVLGYAICVGGAITVAALWELTFELAQEAALQAAVAAWEAALANAEEILRAAAEAAIAAAKIALDFCVECLDAPPVVWSVDGRIIQSGWNGLSDPNHVWADARYIKSTSNGAGGSAANTVNETWDLAWSLGGHDTTASHRGRLGPHKLTCSREMTSSWSSNFIMEDAEARLSVSAWVRGAPGTMYVAEVSHQGTWSGSLNDSGSAAISGLNADVASSANGSVQLALDRSTDDGIQVAQGQTRIFDDIPGVVYTRVSFEIDGASLLTDSGRIRHSAGESCIIACSPPSQVSGTGQIVSRYRVFLADGEPPTPPALTMDTDGTLQVPVGDPVGVRVVSTDPDGGNIIDYEWSVDDVIVQAGQSDVLAWAPTKAGRFMLRIEAADDEGMWASNIVELIVVQPGDINGDGIVGFSDLIALLAAWGSCPAGDPCPADLDGDGNVSLGDLLALLAAWSTDSM